MRAQDSTFEFEKRRNVPVRYDRDLMQTTLKAMDRVLSVRQKRQNAFITKRLLKDKAKMERQEQLRHVEQNLDLVMAPAAAQRQKEALQVAAQGPKQMEIDG